MHLERFKTQIEPGYLDRLVQGTKLADLPSEKLDEIVKLTDVEPDYLQELFGVCGHFDKTIPLQVEHPHLRPFRANFTVLGSHMDSLWGGVVTQSVVVGNMVLLAESLSRDQDVVMQSLAEEDGFENVALLRPLTGDVYLVIGATEGSFDAARTDISDALNEVYGFTPDIPRP